MIQAILTAFYVFWLCAALLLLWLIWRNGERYMRHLEKTLIDATLKTADSAKIAAEAARVLAERFTEGKDTRA